MTALGTAPTPTRRPRRLARFGAPLAVALAVVAGVTTANAAPAAQAADNPYQRGPNPTASSIEASTGSFAIASTTVSRVAVSGFGGGTIYYPTSTAEGTFGAVAISPGFTALQSSIQWLGPRLASQGFVVFTIDTLTTYDQPDSRGRQLLAALDYLTTSSSVRSRIDSGRLGVIGHSMGGGGTLEAARSRPTLQAAVPLTGWNLTTNWSSLRVPTLVVGAQSDTIAPVAQHSIPFYNSLPTSLDRAYLELRGASHFAPNTANTTIAKYTLSWLKRFIDDDTRYEQFLCPLPSTNLSISAFRGNCPHLG
ncbi:bis(hydroxyethyl) terephthalate hydrolase [Actinokineospora bangkokensis]|uniref:Alpha/beta hydrolase n=1 Tax=Actinokineospora bangkokensis TaxID=1193682 RepID=A0A1Q9LLU8_9PSEU|nr:dienelactone hydrolase family protein [Actinokineospora bangkokensis]OLR92979.1 alpha/beta hydrolase [Actinokineospora bangkokensis]